MEKHRGVAKGARGITLVIALLLIIYTLQGLVAIAALSPFQGTDPKGHSEYSSVRPNDFDPNSSDGWELTGEKSDDPYHVVLSLFNRDLFEKELQGAKGASVDKAWETTMGRSDVLIAALGSGIRWQSGADMAELARKFRLNPGELLPPLGSDRYDKNGDGILNVDDYTGDSRASDVNGNGIMDPEDIIWAFSDGMDNDNNGYIDDICGWDFLEDDNDPWDEADDGGGTLQCRLLAAEAGNGNGTPGACPGAMILPVRVGYPNIVDMNDIAQGIVFAVDSGAWVIQEGLESYNNTSFGQEAIDYAWSKGVAVITSAGEEGSAQGTFPAACERTLGVNSITKYREMGNSSSNQLPASYLYLGGLTNYGPHSMLSCPSGRSASEAAATAAGIAGLLYSEAENRVARGEVWSYSGMKTPLSACELKQLMTMTCDDIDFSGDESSSSFGELDPLVGPTRRVSSTPGWDPYFGYGRVNAAEAVRAVAEGLIPPEAEIRSPKWFDLINPGQVSLDVVGRVAAARADSYQYTVQFGPGSNPAPNQWSSVHESEPQFEPADGVLASIDLGRVYRSIEETMKARGGSLDPNRYAFTVRVRVRDNLGNWGEDRKTFFCFDDPDAYLGTPLQVGSGISAPPRLADLDGDGVNEIIVATSDGSVHAYKPDFNELPGWPVHVMALPIHDGAPAFSTGGLSRANYASINGAPAIGDLNHDGTLEVVAADAEGRVYAWDKDGVLMHGFPVRSNTLYSIPDRDDWSSDGRLPPDWSAARFVPDRIHKLDRWNRLDKSFLCGPVLCNLDNSRDGSLEILASCMDQHLYAWHLNGVPVAGWPIKLIDPGEVAEFNPVTHTCKFKEPEKNISPEIVPMSPSVADLNGDGFPEVVCGTNEFYGESLNVSSDSTGLLAYLERLSSLAPGLLNYGNGRAYAVYGDGFIHGLQPGSSSPASQVPASAYMEGWPVRLAAVTSGLVKTGGAAAIGDIDRDNAMEIAISAAGGLAYLLDADGTSHLGYGEDGLPLCFQDDAIGASPDSADSPVVSRGGGGCFLNLDSQGLAYVAGSMGMGRIIDRLLPEDQAMSDDQVSAWSIGDGKLRAHFPMKMDDISSPSPAGADIDGDGFQEVLASSTCDLHALDATGSEVRGWPKFIGASALTTPAVGDCDADGRQEIVAANLGGWLLAWRTSAQASSVAEWPEYGRDPRATACLGEDGIAPGRVTDLSAEVVMDWTGVRLTWTAPGDDGFQGQALCYDIRYLDRPIDDANWMDATPLDGKPLPAMAGSRQEMLLQDFLSSPQDEQVTLYFALQARDETGNISAISSLGSVSF